MGSFYPPCPKITEGIGQREIECGGVLVPLSMVTEGTDDKDHILPIGQWVCTKCKYALKIDPFEYRI